MDNPFDSVAVTSKPRVKRTFKLNEMFEFFPEESNNSIALKRKIAEKVKIHKPELSDFQLFKLTQMFFNKYFYKLRYFDEQTIDKFISSTEEFELFKTI
tara:strand:+ start:829 stop:1125 length:297 start_codon:yes stop_codon:yes gene_type:complete